MFGPAGPSSQVLYDRLAEYPEGSMSRHLLERCLEAAVGRGVDVAAEYKPWLPVDVLQTLIIDMHDALGCSWLTAIVAACISIRMLTLPITVSGIRGSREKALLQPQFNAIMDKQTAAKEAQDQKRIVDAEREMQAFTQKHGRFYMLKGTGPIVFVTAPLYITAFAAMRDFAGHPDLFTGFAMEAPLWLDSLALADPYVLLPMFTAAVMLTNIELFGSMDSEMQGAMQRSGSGGVSTVQKYQKWFQRGAAIAFVPIMYHWSFPAGVFVSMSTNMVVSSMQIRLLKHPVLERLLELPPRPEESKAAEVAATRPPALLPLGNTLPHMSVPQWHPGARAQGKARALPSALSQAALKAAVPALPGPAPVAAAAAAAAAATPSGLEGLKVSPQYAVKRKRPALPELEALR